MTENRATAGERFWGHVGIEFPDTPFKTWSPISQAEASRLAGILSSGCRRSGWLAVKTLNNRMLLLNPAQWESFSLLDDGDDWPEGDSRPDSGLDDYAGMPAELYQRMAEWSDGDGEFGRNNSAAAMKATLTAIECGGFMKRREELRAILRHTVIHYVSGKTKCYEADRADLYDLIEIEGDNDAGTVKISEIEGVEHFYSLDKLRMIDIPMVELNAVINEIEADAK